MNDRQAEAEAIRRWGRVGRAWHPDGEVKDGMCWCVVGDTDGYPDARRWTIYGVGESWEKTFADATARGH